MAAPKHTPGPLFAIPHEKWVGANWMVTANPAHNWAQASNAGIASVAGEGNARLFSAAPDLFKELSEAVANVERVTDGGRLANPELAAWLTRARAAIAKAKGEA